MFQTFVRYFLVSLEKKRYFTKEVVDLGPHLIIIEFDFLQILINSGKK